jgi:adenylate cyclase
MVSSSAQAMSADDTAEERALKGEKRVATILYFSVSHDDDAYHSLSPAEKQVRLDRWLGEICREVIAQGGDIDKILGDKVLAVFYHATGKQVETMVLPAIEHKACTAALNLIQRQRSGILPISLRIGMNTGEVIAGLMGSRHRRDYTVIGDAVNLAARCCSVADQGDNGPFVATDRATSPLQTQVIAHPLDVTSVKGKNEAVRLFRIESPVE